MIRAVENKPLDMTDDEFEYYLAILKAFGDNIFFDIFEVDEDEGSLNYGCITMVKPPINKNLPLGVVFFAFNLMLNQRVRKFDEMLKKLEKKDGK